MTKPPRVGTCLDRRKAYSCLKFLGMSRPSMKSYKAMSISKFYFAKLKYYVLAAVWMHDISDTIHDECST